MKCLMCEKDMKCKEREAKWCSMNCKDEFFIKYYGKLYAERITIDEGIKRMKLREELKEKGMLFP